MKKVSIVIPCYRSEDTIESVVEELIEFLSSRITFEIILVNDASPDSVWNVIQSLIRRHGDLIKGICFAKNFGQHAAIMAGFRATTGDVIVQMDDDGQANIEQIFILLDKLDEGYDAVFARYPQKKESLFRRCMSKANTCMCNFFLEVPKGIEANSFCVYRRFIVEEIIRYNRSYPYLGGLVFRATSNVCNVTIEHRERKSGTSNYTFLKLLHLWLNGFTSFSVKPLESGILLGVLIALIGFLYAVFIIIQKLVGVGTIAGWSSIISLILVLGGLNLIMIGLVGEYVGRIYIGVNNAPQYVVRETINLEDKEAEVIEY